MADSFADVETAAFADGALAHNIATGALCRLNSTAADVLALMQAGKSPPEAAQHLAETYDMREAIVLRDVETLTRAWSESGLTRANTGARIAVDDEEMTAPRFEPALDLTVSCGGPAVQVVCEDAELAALLAEVLAPAFAADDGEALLAANNLQLSGRDGDYRCWVGDECLWRIGPRPIARRLILQEVIVRSLPGGPPAAILHASAVLLDGQAIILAGTSGSGKSTLTAGLIAAGGMLIADDLLPLGAVGEGVWPVPFALSAKEGSWPVLEPLFAGFDRLRTLTSRGNQVRYLAPALAERGKSVPAGIVVFPEWDAESQTTCKPVSEADIADQLIATGTDLQLASGGVQRFAGFCNSVRGYRITYPDLHKGIEGVRSTLSEPT